MRKIRKAYDPHKRYVFETFPVSMTHQSEAPACDINAIMLKWQKTGVVEHRNTFESQYGDFTKLPASYHESMNAVLAAGDMFDKLPSSVRKKFANDPGNFIEFVSDPSNASEMVKMGLATAKSDDDVLDTRSTSEAAPAASKTPPKEAPKSE